MINILRNWNTKSYYYITRMFCLGRTASLFIKTSLIDSQNGFRTISTTSTLLAEPPRKKRRVDPAILRLRVERKMRKYEKEINKLENDPRQPIPILEYELTSADIRDLKARPGRDTEDIEKCNIKFKAAQRLWSFYRAEESRIEKASISKIIKSQDRVLKQLMEIDEDLYNKTISIDDITLLPYTSNHARTETCPNPNYTPPDGYIKDISKVWVM